MNLKNCGLRVSNNFTLVSSRVHLFTTEHKELEW